MPASGPSGNPNNNHATSNKIQTNIKAIEYGTMVAMMVPIPAFGSYFWKKAMIKAKKLIIGEITLVTLSPIR